VGEHEGRLAVRGDDIGERHRLARSGDAEERLVPIAPDQSGGELSDGLGLVSGGSEGGNDFNLRHAGIYRIRVFFGMAGAASGLR
jgi:hypothetical protein